MPLEFSSMGGSACNFGCSALFQWIRKGELILDPPFQRGSVWTTEQQEAWILSVLGGLPLPAVFVNKPSAFHTEWGTKMVVIDGRQRLEAMMAFEDDKLLVNGEKFSEQSVRFNRKWGFLCLPTVFTGFETKRECVELYVRLLTTGTAHTDKEIDKAAAMLKAFDKQGNSCVWCGAPIKLDGIQQICTADCSQSRWDEDHPEED